MRTGLALSGGGVRGLAHVGIIKAFRENNIHIDEYSGSSAGALVAAMAAADCTIQDMLDFWLDTKPLSILNIVFGEPAIFNTMNYIDPIKKFVKHENFEDLPFKLTVCATAMLSGKLHFFDSGPLWPIVLASATFPVVFSPVEWEGEIYMDGGIIDNFPVEPLRPSCDFVIGINVDPHREILKEDLQTVRDVVERVMDLRFQGDSDIKADFCDVLIQPDRIDFYSTFQTSAMLEIFQLGYEAGLKAVPEIRRKLSESQQNI